MSDNPDALPCTLGQAIFKVQDNLRDRFGDALVLRHPHDDEHRGYLTIYVPGSNKGFEVCIQEVWLNEDERDSKYVVGDHEGA